MTGAELYILLYIGATLTTALSPGGEAELQFSPSGVRVVEQHVVPDTGLPGLTVWTFTQVPTQVPVQVTVEGSLADTGLPGLRVWTFAQITQITVGGLLAASPLSCTVK